MTPTAPTPAEPEIVAVCAPTCNRPDGLKRLLDTFLSLKAPHDAQLMFIIVDNGLPEHGAQGIVADFAKRTAYEVHFFREETRGIPHVHNAMFDHGMAINARWMMLIDDDEGATPDWVVEMLPVLRQSGAMLVGGPLRPEPDHKDLNRAARDIFDVVRADTETNNAERARNVRNGVFPGHVWSNNCGVCMEQLRDSGLRYDISHNDSGGSDGAFSMSVHASGYDLAWAPEAHVIEFFNAKRLTYGFHYRYWRDWAQMDAKVQNRSRAFCLKDGARQAFLALTYAVRVWGSPRHKVQTVRAAGRAAGRIRAALGGHSRRYEKAREVNP